MSETLQLNLAETQQLKSFDVLSSVRLYQHDLKTDGYIRPETRQRVYDEELSYIAEGINRPNFTEFVIEEIDGQLVYYHNGQWRPYIGTLLNGLKAAKQEAALDFRRSFEVERRVDDLRRGYQMMGLAAGEKMRWFYDFPADEAEAYGAKFLQDMGYQPERRLGYICTAEKTTNGQTIIRQQSVDNSDPQAFRSAMIAGEQGGSIDDMRLAYDQSLSRKDGGQYYAGRDLSQEASRENAWDIVVSNRDLIENYFLAQIENLAAMNLPPEQAETAKKRLTYGVWAALKERLDRQTEFGPQVSYGSGDIGLSQEVSNAYGKLAERGETLFGCGGSITGEKAVLNADPKDVFSGIFGGKREKMHCPFCGAAQYGDPCSPNQFCTACTAKVENGKIVSRGKGRLPRKGFMDILSEELAEFNRRYYAQKAEKESANQVELERSA